MEIFSDTSYHMWFVLCLTVWASVSFVREKIPIEVTSVILLTALLLFGQIFPLYNPFGRNMLDAASLLSGFANPALIAVLALLVMGQGIVQTDALGPAIRLLRPRNKKWAYASAFMVLFLIMALSAFMNNVPLVILAIPVIQAIAQSGELPESRVMMPLSFVSILGGMMTLIGSSTNMLVSSSLVELGYKPLEFFSFIVPGAIMALAGFAYVLLIMPRLIPERFSPIASLEVDDRKFYAEIDVAPGSALVGVSFEKDRLPGIDELRVVYIRRGAHLISSLFSSHRLQVGDIITLEGRREDFAVVLARQPEFFVSETERRIVEAQARYVEQADSGGEDDGAGPPDLDEKVAETPILAELMVSPASRFADMTLRQLLFQREFGVIVMGLHRGLRGIRFQQERLRLEAGDVLLVWGSRGTIDAIRGNQNLIVLSGSKTEVPQKEKAPLAAMIMLATIAVAAIGLISIPVAAITGAVLMIGTGCLNIRQATRAIDRKILMLVGSMFALGTALQVAGGARFIAEGLLALPFADMPIVIISLMFFVIALCTNILSNNACAILFTPIAVSIANDLGINVHILAITVILAANCSFASPVGYKTNLLVMGPGHYNFADFVRAGLPLVFLMWLIFTIIARYYYGL